LILVIAAFKRLQVITIYSEDIVFIAYFTSAQTQEEINTNVVTILTIIVIYNSPKNNDISSRLSSVRTPALVGLPYFCLFLLFFVTATLRLLLSL
jgi:hypothetical protein